MNTFFDRVIECLSFKIRSKRDLAKVLSLSEPSIFNMIRDNKEPDFLNKLRKLAVDHQLTPDDLYYIVVGKRDNLDSEITVVRKKIDNIEDVLLKVFSILEKKMQIEKKH